MATRGTITYVFDDGYKSIYTHVVPLLRAKNIPAVFAVALDETAVSHTEKRPTIPWRTWLQLRAEGHEIAAHSITHRDLTTLDIPSLERELKEPAATLDASTLVYPGGGVNEAVAHQAGRYYTAARTVQHGMESIPPQDAMQLKTYNFTANNFSVLKANVLALTAWLTNAWLIETYHIVDDTETEAFHRVKLSDFARHLAFVAKLHIRVRTIKDVINSTKTV